jgi:hypothetical protein
MRITLSTYNTQNISQNIFAKGGAVWAFSWLISRGFFVEEEYGVADFRENNNNNGGDDKLKKCRKAHIFAGR